ncbi:MAG TPA: pyridoxamine 5'-phosphate oxidase family protein, partial [Actinomycetota bacterium]|nr:pyridoxamine 5'-phosphate oxidase family protein [Actinomycetota bacterium]
DPEEKLHAMGALVEHLIPGRWDDVRRPNPKELRATSILALSLDEASAKVRTGGPIDDEEDYELPMWAGVVPLELTPSKPIPDERLATGTRPPRYVSAYRRPR